jgi:O-antigen/teichoic acid export membrane protein
MSMLSQSELARTADRPGSADEPRKVSLMRAAPARSSHLTNIALLIIGLGGGQGVIFAVQTWLVAQGELELLSRFGTHYSFAILAIILTDGGASTILAREMARFSGGESAADEFWRIFSETVLFRLSIATLIATGALIYGLVITSDGFSRAYVLCALPGLLLWAGNVVGLLDGLGLSGISGITGALAYAASAIALAVVQKASPELAGSILGGAFSGGYLLTVLAQWMVLRRYGWPIRIEKVTAAGLTQAFRNGSAMLFQLLPGQIGVRIQLALSATYLGPETTAVFTYVKQIITAVTMIVNVVLRVEFPGLVQQISRTSSQGFRTDLAAHKTSIGCAVAFAAGAIIVSSLSYMMPPNRFSAAGHALLIFAPTILTISLSMMMMQAMVARGEYVRVAGITAAGAALGIAVSYVFVTIAGLYAFLAGELAFHLLGFVLMYRSLARGSRPSYQS